MFEPQFNLTGALETRLQSLNETNTFLRRLAFRQNKMSQLRKDTLMKSTYLILHAENQEVGYGHIVRILESGKKSFSDPTDQYIVNMYAALEKVRRLFSKTERLSTEKLVDFHELFDKQHKTNNSTSYASRSYREAPKPILDTENNRLYSTPSKKAISSLVTDLFDWLNFETSSGDPFTDTMLKAICAYFQILIIRPWQNNNGKMAWFLFSTILNKNDIDFGGYVPLEKGLFFDRLTFQENILHLIAKNYNPEDYGRSEFQSYITDTLRSIEDIVIERRSFLEQEHFKEVGEMLKYACLNERQEKALHHIAENGRITNRKYKELNGIRSRKLAWNELKTLIKAELLISAGKGRNTAYEFSPIIIPETVLKHLGNN